MATANEVQIRLRLNDLHLIITDALECIDEHAYNDADAALDHMQADIDNLRKNVSALVDHQGLFTT
jgi:hypothetical protein